VFDLSERETREQERETALRVEESRENERFRETSAVDWFFLLFFSLCAARRAVERIEEEKKKRSRFLSFPTRELFFFTLSPLLFSLRFYANWSRAHIAGDDGGDISLSLSLSLRVPLSKNISREARDHRRLMMRRRDFSLSKTKSLVVKEKKRKKWKGPEKKNASPQKRTTALLRRAATARFSVPCVREACLRNSFFSVLLRAREN
jgi:hypothetical protein